MGEQTRVDENDLTLRDAYLHNLVLDMLNDWLPRSVTQYEVDISEYEPPQGFSKDPLSVRICVDFVFAGRQMGTTTIIHGRPSEITDRELVLHMIRELIPELQSIQLRSGQYRGDDE